MSDEHTRLSPRQELFITEFLKHGNATRAYIRAGYSPRGAQTSASRLLRRPRIRAAVAARRRRLSKALDVSVQRVMREYAKIAFANVADFVSVEEDGRLRIDLEKSSLAQQAGIVELRVRNQSKQEQEVVVKLDKLRALDSLALQLGMPDHPARGLADDLRNARLRLRAGRPRRELRQ